MRRRYAPALVVVGLALLSVGLGAAGSASAALMGQPANSPFLAIYGSPGASKPEPIGGGLGRNFGFGENMLFEASTERKVGKSVGIVLLGKTSTSEDVYLGGTLQSNKTGENNPLGFVIQFADFQDSALGGVATPHYSDTSDRPWIANICAPNAEKCRVDPLFEVGATKVNVKIESVSLDINGTVLQGTVWGQWINGEAGKAPCIRLENPPAKAAANQTLIETQGPAVGAPITSIGGEACLISANNDWYRISSSIFNEPPITIKNE